MRVLAAHEPGSQRPPKLLETRTQEAELPRRVTVRYLARDNDYQAATQQAQLIQDLYETRNELVLELPVVMTDDEAKRAAWAILASAWVERDGFELYLPPSFLTLDPGDVVDALKITEALTATIRLRLTEIDLSGGWLLKLKGVTDDPIVWQTNHLTGAPAPASEQTGIPFEVPSQGFFLNLPALSAEDGQTGAFWLGAAPAWSLEDTKWRGAVIYRSSDGVSFTDHAAITTAVAWAKATTVLPAYERSGVREHRQLALDALRRQALGPAGQRQQPRLGQRPPDHRRVAHSGPGLGWAGGPAIRRRPTDQHHHRHRHRQLAALPFRLPVHRQRGARRGLRAVLRRVRRRLGRRHGRPLERQPARHALAGGRCGVLGWRWRGAASRDAAAGGHHRRGLARISHRE